MNKTQLTKFFSLKFSSQLLLIEASLYTIWAYLFIRLFSFKKYINWIKNPKRDTYNENEVRKVALTIKRINKFAFWKTTCYTQAISARLILKRKSVKSQIFLGICKQEDGNLLAHAWTKVNDKIITGGNVNIDKYKVLYIFED